MRKILLSILLTFLSFNLLSQFCSATALVNMGVLTPTTAWQNASNAASSKRYWRFNATAGCVYDFSTCNSAFTNDTYLRLYSTATGGTVLAQNDDNGPFCTGTKASLTWTCPTTGTYSILVTNFSCANLSATTILSYRVTCGAPPFNPCSSITTLTCGVSTTFTIASGNGAYNPPSTTCGFSTPGQEKIFQFTPTVTGNYTITQPTSFGYIDWFYKLASGGCSGTGWTCIDDISSGNVGNANVNISLFAGQTYYIMGDPESTTGGSVTFTLNCPVVAPVNDLICNATTISCGQSLNGTTIGSTNSGTGEGGSCGTTQTTGGVWYKVVGTGDLMTASLCATAWDSKISVFDGTCTAPVCVGGVDDGGPACAGTSASYQWLSTNGTTYWILVHGFSTTSAFTISLTCSPPPPPGPCFGTVAWGVFDMPTNTIQSVTSSCAGGNGQYTDEYSTWNNAIAGETYNVQTSYLTDWITVTVGSPSGSVVAFGGGGILTFSATLSGTYYVHVNTNGYCGDDANCRDVTVYKNVSLPVELIYFKGENHGNYNLLEWSTATENNSDYYLLESSTDGSKWSSVITKSAAGWSNIELKYTYSHYTELTGVVYYRLFQYDFDGNYDLYGPIAVNKQINSKTIVKYINTLGQEVTSYTKGIVFIVYDDGTMIKTIR
jgi:hypothetical protein